jgi:hypothetical protein
MSCRAKIYLQKPCDTLALSIGTRAVTPRVVAGARVCFEHDGRTLDGVVRTIDPLDWERRGVTPAIVVALSAGDER